MAWDGVAWHGAACHGTVRGGTGSGTWDCLERHSMHGMVMNIIKVCGLSDGKTWHLIKRFAHSFITCRYLIISYFPPQTHHAVRKARWPPDAKPCVH